MPAHVPEWCLTTDSFLHRTSLLQPVSMVGALGCEAGTISICKMPAHHPPCVALQLMDRLQARLGLPQKFYAFLLIVLAVAATCLSIVGTLFVSRLVRG